MKKVCVAMLVLSFASSSMAVAGETLAQSAVRLSREAAERSATVAAPVPRTPSAAPPTRQAHASLAAGQDANVLQRSGMSKRSKMLIYLGIGAGFAAAAFTIDRNVVNVTPSSLGQRQD